jgi:transcriptional regulator with XRE-family HTH domain
MGSKPKINDLKSSSLARGQRLKTARMMTGLTRNAFEEKYRISASTIQSWEAAKAGGLTERGAKRILPALHKEGVTCTTDWLLYGVGSGPQPANISLSISEKTTPSNNAPFEDKAVIQELLAFRNLHPNAIDFLVSDDGMEPHYSVGDYIAGIRRSKDRIEESLEADCIVQTTDNVIRFRRLKRGSRPGLYNLVCINPNTTVFETTLYNQELLSTAPVIWHRRKMPK